MYYIGIDLGGTNIVAGLVNEAGDIICKSSTPTLKERDNDEIIKDMAKVANDVIEISKVDISEVKSLGIGSPGTINAAEGIVLNNSNLKFVNYPIREKMNKYINLPIYVENDANCAAWAEAACGTTKGCKESIFITLGTGVGGGVIIDGKLQSGFNSEGGELGHMVIEVNGEQCGCGRKGCWEAYSSASGLIRDAVRAVEKKPDSEILKLANGKVSDIEAKTVFQASVKGDETAKALVDKYLLYLAEGITNIINMYFFKMYY